ncbi:ATP-binding protein [Haloferax namakaokahaiae]|uniref:histidine kinase n=1 Tax=Haloferax namakaokahaiae TaxID=1748331 RepID=A0ABD5ZI28_9EURY
MEGVRGSDIKPSGFVVALIGFVATRYTVLESVDPSATLGQFVLGQGVFLTLGMGLTVFGIGLAVSSYDDNFVNTIAIWSILGTLSMVAVLAVTFAGTGDSLMLGQLTRSALVANVLIGGAIGGVLTGIRAAATNEHRQELTAQADRLTVLNRILRHEVLNKVNVIRGYADLGTTDTAADASSLQVIQRNADRIDASISELRAIVGPVDERPVSTNVHEAITNAVEGVRTDYPEANVSLDVDDHTARVLADAHLDMALCHLVENAIVHAGTQAPQVDIGVTTNAGNVTIDIADEGPGVSDRIAAVVEDRNVPEYDDPTMGFGLTLVRLLVVDTYGGSVEIDSSDTGSVVRVTLARPGENGVIDTTNQYGVPPWVLGATTVAAIVAGVVMGVVFHLLTGSLAVIGGLYGVMNGGVGWVMHLFHSVVFGVLFAVAVVRQNPRGAIRSPLKMTGLGIGYGVFLSFVAAGVIMPLWLQAVGIPATVPTLSLPGLFAHIVWGGVFGGVFGLALAWRQ